MANRVELLSRDVREWALNNLSTLENAIDSVLDIESENDSINSVQEASIRSELQRKMAGFSFLQSYLEDENVEEVWINKPGEIWFAKSGMHFSQQVAFSSEELKTLVERMIRPSGRRLDRATPFIDAQLESGYRLHAVIPDITRQHLSLNIRKFSNQVLTIEDLINRGVLKKLESEFLMAELRSGANLIISGATQAGKTTLLSALLSALSPSERVVSVEDTFELRCLLPDWVAMQTRPESLEGKHGVDLRKLVKETLRMRPTRLVVGEVRGAEALDMLIAMNSGIASMCTVHANSCAEGLQKILTLPMLAGGNITSTFLENLVKSSIRLFVHCERDTDGRRRVQSIMRIKAGSNLELEEIQL